MALSQLKFLGAPSQGMICLIDAYGHINKIEFDLIMRTDFIPRESSLVDLLEGIPPTFASKPTSRIVEEGTTMELECRLVAVPEPDITWMCNGKKVKETKRISFLVQSDVHMYCHILHIEKVTRKDAGMYEIIARNQEGEAVNAISVTVQVMSI